MTFVQALEPEVGGHDQLQMTNLGCLRGAVTTARDREWLVAWATRRTVRFVNDQ